MKTVPPSVFKYVPPARVDIILNERIAFTPPNQFKDEYDVCPKVKPVTDRTFLRRQAKETGREFLKSLPRGQRPRNKSQRREIFRRLRAGAVEDFRGQAKEFAEDLEAELQGEISMEFGVLCLSDVQDENLLWEESADQHRGFVIEFDTAQVSFRAMGQLVPVEYVPCRPIYDPVVGAKGFWRQKLKEKFGYEREWRMSRRLNQCTACHVDGATIYLCPLSRASIRGIYFGLHSGNELEKRVREALVETTPDLYRACSEKGASKLSFRKL